MDDHFTLALPRYAKILSFQAHGGQPQLCALVDPEEKALQSREFRFAGTGHSIKESDTDLSYIGTCQMLGGDLMWHLFEIIRF
jgi:hypothetical protein